MSVVCHRFKIDECSKSQACACQDLQLDLQEAGLPTVVNFRLDPLRRYDTRHMVLSSSTVFPAMLS